MRLRAGLSQAAVAVAIGTSRSLICRLEQGQSGVALRTRFRLAALLGADLRLTAYEGSGAMIRGAVQATVLEWLLAVRHRRWRPTVEAWVPGPSRRSIDLVLNDPTDTVLFGIETRLNSLEEIVRELHSKRLALTEGTDPANRRSVHVVLVRPASRRHRAIVQDHPQIIKAAFPMTSAVLEYALTATQGAWPGDGILWVRGPSRLIDAAKR